MKELFYQLYFFEREDETLPVVHVKFPENTEQERIDKFDQMLKDFIKCGYDPDETESRDDWVEMVLDGTCEAFSATWHYEQVAGTLIIK